MRRETIISVQNPRVKAARRLRERRERDERQQFLIDGAREIRRAIAAGVPLVEAFLCDPLLKNDESRAARDEIVGCGIPCFDVPPAVFSRLAFGDREEGIVVVAQMRHCSLDDVVLPPEALVVVVEGLEKPGNLGGILRTTDAAGVGLVIVANGIVDLFNPNCIRASLGTLFTVPVCRASSVEALAWLRKHKLPMFAARVDADLDYWRGDFNRSSAIVLGAEAPGLSSVWQAPDVIPVKIPMHGAADSLNVSVAAAVLLFEARRQRA